jgi:hypothetical protein
MTLQYHQHIVACTFRFFSYVAGIPAATVLVFSLCWRISNFFTVAAPPAPDSSEYLDVKTYGLVALLSNTVKAVGTVIGGGFQALDALMDWMMGGLAIASFVLALVCAVLYSTANGIDRHAQWARVVGVVMLICFLILWYGALMMSSRVWTLLPCIAISFVLYSMWSLVWKY